MKANEFVVWMVIMSIAAMVHAGVGVFALGIFMARTWSIMNGGDDE